MRYTKAQIEEASIRDLELMIGARGATKEDYDYMSDRVSEIEEETGMGVYCLKQLLKMAVSKLEEGTK